MRFIFSLILLSFAASAYSNPFSEGDALTGQNIFEQNKCNRCHDSMMGGDGNKIFTRNNRKVSTPAELISQITLCSGNVGANFTLQDKQNIAAYLNRYYQLK